MPRDRRSRRLLPVLLRRGDRRVPSFFTGSRLRPAHHDATEVAMSKTKNPHGVRAVERAPGAVHSSPGAFAGARTDGQAAVDAAVAAGRIRSHDRARWTSLAERYPVATAQVLASAAAAPSAVGPVSKAGGRVQVGASPAEKAVRAVAASGVRPATAAPRHSVSASASATPGPSAAVVRGGVRFASAAALRRSAEAAVDTWIAAGRVRRDARAEAIAAYEQDPVAAARTFVPAPPAPQPSSRAALHRALAASGLGRTAAEPAPVREHRPALGSVPGLRATSLERALSCVPGAAGRRSS
jgi:hypothetical protein